MEKWRLSITVEIPAGTKLSKGGSQAVCDECWDTVNSIANCKAYYWKITRLIFNKENIVCDLLCDHYKLRHGEKKTDVNTLKDMEFEIACLKRCFGVAEVYLKRNPNLKPYFSNELIEIYNGEEN